MLKKMFFEFSITLQEMGECVKNSWKILSKTDVEIKITEFFGI